jgi:flagellar biosynthesis/type III secretory pathway M-ring protein FliF/YscJ
VLGAISTMLGYYVIILTAAMVLIIVVMQIFKALIARREHDELAGQAGGSESRAEETVEELAAVAIAAVSFMLSSEKPLGVSAWSRVDRGVLSPWKIESRSRRIQYHGG